MKYLLYLLLFLSVTISGFSQTKEINYAGIIKGKVIDTKTGEPISYATITAYLMGQTKVAGGNITDEKGGFIIDNLGWGEYQIKIEFLGYANSTLSSITLSESTPIHKCGDIQLSTDSKSIKEVTVTGSKNYMENKLDKFVYNVEKDITSDGGVATDVLKKVPQVSVDVDGNVELLGSNNIRVFINGRPSTMFDNNLADALRSIPANQIKSIEIITTPGAQYDAQGTGGIINIILKENKSKGLNGSVNASLGTRLNNGSANLHIKKNKLDFSISGGYNTQLRGGTILSSDRKSFSDNTEHVQNGTGYMEKYSYRLQTGLEYEINKRNNLSFNINTNKYTTNNDGSTNQGLYLPIIGIYSNILRVSRSEQTFGSLDFNLNYSKKFLKEGRELNFSAQSSSGTGLNSYTENQKYESQANYLNGAKGNNNLTDRETIINADFANPFTKDLLLNTGLKFNQSAIYTNSDHYLLDTPSNNYVFDPSQLNNFIYNREVFAAYITLVFPLGRDYTMKTGIRDEYTNIQKLASGTSDPSYNSFIPSIVLSKKIDAHKNIKLSYTKRIQRAGYRELNPFIDATDPTNLIQGNPYLRPERSDVFELNYFQSFEGGSTFMVTGFSRNTIDDEQNYVYDTSLVIGSTTYKNVSISTNENAGHQYLTGLNISGTLKLGKKLELRGNINAFDKHIISNLVANTTINSINYRSNINASYKLNETIAMEFFGNFNSARTEIQGKFPSFTSYSFAFRKLLFHKKGSLAFTTTNPFNEYVDQATNVNGVNFSLVADKKIPYRSFGLSFSYKFGKMEYKDKKPEKELNQEEGN